MADTTTGGSAGLGQDLGSIYDLIRGITGGDQSAYDKAAGIADPLNKYRGQAGTMLMDLLTKPGSFTTDPGYQFALTQGQDAIKGASNALYGTARTGSLAPELAKYTEGYASQAYNDRVKQLFDIASGNPAAAGALTAEGTVQNQKSLGGGLGGLGNILGELFGLGSGTGSGGSSSLLGLLQKAFGGGGGGMDFSGLDLSGISGTDFLTQLGIDPSSLSPEDLSILGIDPSTLTSDISTSIGDLGGINIDQLLGGGLGDTGGLGGGLASLFGP